MKYLLQKAITICLLCNSYNRRIFLMGFLFLPQITDTVNVGDCLSGLSKNRHYRLKKSASTVNEAMELRGLATSALWCIFLDENMHFSPTTLRCKKY